MKIMSSLLDSESLDLPYLVREHVFFSNKPFIFHCTMIIDEILKDNYSSKLVLPFVLAQSSSAGFISRTSQCSTIESFSKRYILKNVAN